MSVCEKSGENFCNVKVFVHVIRMDNSSLNIYDLVN